MPNHQSAHPPASKLGATELQQSIQPALLSAEHTARYLGVSARTLATMTAEGIVPSLTIGRRRLYCRASLDLWIAERVQSGGGL
jgi:excisionase family DNA binding protein